MMDFSIQIHFTTLRNSSSEESEDEIALNLLESMLTLYLRKIAYVSLLKTFHLLLTEQGRD